MNLVLFKNAFPTALIIEHWMEGWLCEWRIVCTVCGREHFKPVWSYYSSVCLEGL